jgi:hypothetical protein
MAVTKTTPQQVFAPSSGNSLAVFIDAADDTIKVKDVLGQVDVLTTYTGGGNKGEKGATGAQGPAGAKGATGAQGPVGPAGAKGDLGAKGDAGAKGATGAQGPAGPKGATGSKGDLGTKGDEGAKGAKGAQGPAGPAGAKGVEGPQGPAGPKGATGSKGDLGTKGQKGIEGTPPDTAPTYVLKVKFVSGSVDSVTPFDGAEDPSGASLIGASGWTFTRNGVSEITIDHPENNLAVNLMTHAQNTATAIISRSIVGTTTGNSANQTTSASSINIKGLSGTFIGVNTGAGPFYVYITWQFPTNNILI